MDRHGGSETPDQPLAPLSETMLRLDPHARPVLIGGRRHRDGRLVYPCPTGHEGDDYQAVPLSTHGKLWSFTVQRFRPKPPYAIADDSDFRPYVVGYVEMPEGIVVEARVAADPAALRIGMAMSLETVEVRTADGRVGILPAFGPERERAR